MIDTSANLVISKSNEVFLKINTEPHIEYELRDHFKFEVPNAKFMPQYRGRNWNGEIHLYDMRSKQIYVGLLDKIVSRMAIKSSCSCGLPPDHLSTA